jgi:CDP-diacylglycerol--glycerol-3-phosphate 3-phosphatidyltransferase
VSRVLLAPFLVILILASERSASFVAAGLFVAAAATDGLDGYLARRHATTSRTGQWLDPLADKILVAAPIATLTALGKFPLWASLVIVVREIGISVLRAYLGMKGRSMPASRAAKLKTTSQMVAITAYILPLGQDGSAVKLALLVLAVALTALTGLDYAARAAGWLGWRGSRAPKEAAVR